MGWWRTSLLSSLKVVVLRRCDNAGGEHCELMMLWDSGVLVMGSARQVLTCSATLWACWGEGDDNWLVPSTLGLRWWPSTSMLRTVVVIC